MLNDDFDNLDGFDSLDDFNTMNSNADGFDSLDDFKTSADGFANDSGFDDDWASLDDIPSMESSGVNVNQGITATSFDIPDIDPPVINTPGNNTSGIPKKYSEKIVALIIAGAAIFLALIFIFIDKIHIKKKPVQQAQQVQVEAPVTDVGQNVDTNVQGQPNSAEAQKGNETNNANNTAQNNSAAQTDSLPVGPNDVLLHNVGANPNLAYSDTFELNGTVVDKQLYVQNQQVVYAVVLQAVFGSTNQELSYYCNLNTYNAVNVGDMVVIQYQQLNENFISISAVVK